ncbi:MAG: TRAP transporter substrate-binding protein DctP [Spirochaetes bacterium]|nr:TRAP transporter substrate-binding protein DctP [Spirochaetota bacterium]
MKRIIIVTICLFFISFCSGLNPAVVKAEKPIELRFAHTIPPFVPLAKAYQNWAAKVAKDTKGRVKINIFWGESLLKATELYRGTQTGVADMAYYAVGIDWGLTPLNMVMSLGFMGIPSRQAGTEIYEKLWKKFPEIGNEFKGVKVYAARMQPPYQFSFKKKKVRVPDDVKGMKLISLGGSFAAEMKTIGATPIDIKVGDLYVSLERGLADGISALMPVVDGFGIMKLVPNHTIFKGGTTSTIDMVLINPKTWEKLPDDVKKILMDMEPWVKKEFIKFDELSLQRATENAKKMKHDFIYPTEAETKLWEDAVKPVHDKWIKDTEAKGLPANAVYKELKKLIKTY